MLWKDFQNVEREREKNKTKEIKLGENFLFPEICYRLEKKKISTLFSYLRANSFCKYYRFVQNEKCKHKSKIYNNISDKFKTFDLKF